MDSVTFKQFYLDKGVTPNEFDLEQVSNDFMLKTLSNLNAHKGAGLDGLSSPDRAGQLEVCQNYSSVQKEE